MARRTQSPEEEAGAIDLTPMLDVVFIMLIFFIVTASFIKIPGIEVNRPEATNYLEKKNAAILIALNDKNEIWIDKKKVDPRSVKKEIERIHVDNPKGSVVIQADAASDIETVNKVYEAATEIGITNIAISTERG